MRAKSERKGADLRAWCGRGPTEATVDGEEVRVWSAPNTARKTKGEDTPPDLTKVLFGHSAHGKEERFASH